MNPHIILPGLLAIVAASLTCSELLKQPSIIFALIRAKEIDQDESLLTDELKSMSVEVLTKPIDDTNHHHKINYRKIKIPSNATIADAVNAFKQTHSNQIYVFNINDTSKTMLGIIDKRDLSEFLRQFNNT